MSHEAKVTTLDSLPAKFRGLAIAGGRLFCQSTFSIIQLQTFNLWHLNLVFMSSFLGVSHVKIRLVDPPVAGTHTLKLLLWAVHA